MNRKKIIQIFARSGIMVLILSLSVALLIRFLGDSPLGFAFLSSDIQITTPARNCCEISRHMI